LCHLPKTVCEASISDEKTIDFNLIVYHSKRHPFEIVADFYKKYWLESDYFKDIERSYFDFRDVFAFYDASGACFVVRWAPWAELGSELASSSTL
jgi:hypothetical protein